VFPVSSSFLTFGVAVLTSSFAETLYLYLQHSSAHYARITELRKCKVAQSDVDACTSQLQVRTVGC
jgi:hypothetical protein